MLVYDSSWGESAVPGKVHIHSNSQVRSLEILKGEGLSFRAKDCKEKYEAKWWGGGFQPPQNTSLGGSAKT